MRRAILPVLCFIAFLACSDHAADPYSPFAVEESGSAGAGQVVLHVSSLAEPNGDGSGSKPFQTIADAVLRANQLDGAHINIAPGRYEVAQTIRIRTSVTISGSNVLQTDAEGLPTGALDAGTETRIVGTAALGANTMFVVSDTPRVVRNVTIRNVTFEAIAGAGFTMLIQKAQGFSIRNNVLIGPALFGINTAASSGDIRGNYITGAGCGACIGGGNTTSPASVDIRNNRIVRNRTGGLLLAGSGTDVDEFADQLDATVTDNDLSDNIATNGFGFGFRIFIIRRDLNHVINTQYTGHVRAVVKGNRLTGNQLGVVLDAGFPYRTVAGTCDPRTYTGSIDLTLRNNTLAGNTGRPALISFGRGNLLVNPAMTPFYQYLHGATFKVADPDGSLAGYTLINPTHDPLTGPCPNDIVSEPLLNQFQYTGI